MEKNSIIEKNPKVQIAIENLYSAFKIAEYGRVYTWDEIAKIMDEPTLAHNQVYYVGIKVNALLMANDQRVSKTIHGYGKKILNPTDHTGAAREKINQSTKKYVEAGKILMATNMEMLNTDEQKRVSDDARKFRTLELFTSELLKKKKLSAGKDGRKELIFDVVKYLSDE